MTTKSFDEWEANLNHAPKMKRQKLTLYLCVACLMAAIYFMQQQHDLLTALFFALTMLFGLFYFKIVR